MIERLFFKESTEEERDASLAELNSKMEFSMGVEIYIDEIKAGFQYSPKWIQEWTDKVGPEASAEAQRQWNLILMLCDDYIRVKKQLKDKM